MRNGIVGKRTCLCIIIIMLPFPRRERFFASFSLMKIETINIMINRNFDRFAEKYDSWFLKNANVLASEAALVAYFLRPEEKILSVGCGSGLFEHILKTEYGITVTEGIEPSADMAEIARARGMNVEICTAEEYDPKGKVYDTILYNGCPGYITDLDKALANSNAALRKGGKVILIDIPKESSYGIMYNLAKTLGTWDHPLLEGILPPNPYPIELAAKACWRTTAEKVVSLEKTGFGKFEYAQTLMTHPVYSDDKVEQPASGYDRGDYVAICGYKL